MTSIQRTVFCLVALMIAPLALAQPAPTWNCLPGDSFVAVRIPGGKKFLELLRDRTKAGSVIYSEERWNRLVEIVKAKGGADWQEMVTDLEKSGLTPEDFGHLFDGEAGLGVSTIDRKDQEPLMLAVLWAEPGEDVATRLVKAIGDSVEKVEGKHKGTRQDIELGGVPVMQITEPVLEKIAPDMEAEWNAEPPQGTMSHDGAPRRLQVGEAPAAAPPAEGEVVAPEPRVVGQTHAFVARLGGRVIVAFGTTATHKAVISKLDAKEEINWDQMTGMEECRTAVAQLFEAHKAGGATDSFVARMSAVPGMDAAMPAGDIGVEGYLNLKPLWQMAARASGDQVPFDQVMSATGLDALGAMGMRASLDGQIVRSGAFIQAAAPRKGLLQMLDEAGLEAKPAAWVPADVLQYTHFALDLGKLYGLIKQAAIEVAGDQAAAGFQMAEQQAQGMLQSDVTTVLSSFGAKHTLIQEPPGTVKVAVGEGQEMSVPSQRMVAVWQVKNVPLWEKLLQVIGVFAQGAQGQVQFAEEQGFKGWRANQPQMQGGLFLGHGHLILGMGEGMTERIMAAVANPPQGAAALQGHERYTRAAGLLKAKPGLFFQVVDMPRYMRMSAEMAKDFQNDPMLLPIPDAELRDMFVEIFKLHPSAEELEGAFGVSAGQGWVDANGFTFESIGELPPK